MFAIPFVEAIGLGGDHRERTFHDMVGFGRTSPCQLVIAVAKELLERRKPERTTTPVREFRVGKHCIEFLETEDSL